MKKNEWITLVAGILIIGAIAWFGGLFTQSNNTKSMDSIVQVSGKNISTDPKIQIIEVKVGEGAEAKKGSHVYVNYIGMLENGTKFDSSYDRGLPIDFNVATGKVIKGWDIGLVGMKVGGKRRLIITPEYAYGVAGVPEVIPPNSTLVFDVELVKIK